MIAVLLIVLLLAGQAIGDSGNESGGGADTTEAVGRAGFAYLTGIRTFVAASLWNRVGPQYHGYYDEIPLDQQVYMLPTIRMVTLLDPEFQQAYYVGAWVLARRGDVDEGIELAREGVEANPRAGLLRSSYAQILLYSVDDVEGAVREADAALDSDWADLSEMNQGLIDIRGIYAVAGETEKEAAVLEMLQELDEELGDTLTPVPHDHDGDGVPDH